MFRWRDTDQRSMSRFKALQIHCGGRIFYVIEHADRLMNTANLWTRTTTSIDRIAEIVGDEPEETPEYEYIGVRAVGRVAFRRRPSRSRRSRDSGGISASRVTSRYDGRPGRLPLGRDSGRRVGPVDLRRIGPSIERRSTPKVHPLVVRLEPRSRHRHVTRRRPLRRRERPLACNPVVGRLTRNAVLTRSTWLLFRSLGSITSVGERSTTRCTRSR